MKKQPMISTISKKTPVDLITEKLNKFSETVISLKNKSSEKTTNEEKPDVIVLQEEKEEYSALDSKVHFEIGELGFDEYGNLVKW